MKSMPARLDLDGIKMAIRNFPNGEGWSTLACRRLRPETGRKRNWECLRHVAKQAGLYAFLLPKARFPSRYTFSLDGPATRKIAFQFLAEDLPTVKNKYFVAYVGRTANLLKRLQWHFHETERSTTAQVRKALVKCGYAKNGRAALDFMLEHGSVAYRLMPGDENVANRDIIEVALWAHFCCPFNIKSER